MSDIAIHIEHLGKCYHISQRAAYDTFQEAIINAASAPFRWLKRGSNSNSSEPQSFWALKDVSFDVENGDVLGIIGRNGSGKSTLLKILSRITVPTEGRAEIHGRAGSLLEVGTGFHPELTGRENIYLSGSILGMKKREIEDKFDEIVRFSEIDKFLDTPVKHYSSGMHVRLAFAVAAHLDPEILLVDEVLAVGDAAFQKKCLGKMKEVSKQERTVLFVSHNMNAIEQLCSSCIMLEGGILNKYSDDVETIIKEYILGQENNPKLSEWINSDNDFNNIWFKPLRFCIANREGEPISMPVSNNSDMWIYIEGITEEFDPALQVGYAIYNEQGTLLYWSCQTDVSEESWPKLGKGRNCFVCKIPPRFLNQGIYRIELIIALYRRLWICQPGIKSPNIFLDIQGGLSDSPYWMVRRPGIISPSFNWECRHIGEPLR